MNSIANSLAEWFVVLLVLGIVVSLLLLPILLIRSLMAGRKSES